MDTLELRRQAWHRALVRAVKAHPSVVYQSAGHWAVASLSRPGVAYDVRMAGRAMACSCEQGRSIACVHRAAVLISRGVKPDRRRRVDGQFRAGIEAESEIDP